MIHFINKIVFILLLNRFNRNAYVNWLRQSIELNTYHYWTRYFICSIGTLIYLWSVVGKIFMTPYNDNNWVIHIWLKMLQFDTVMIWFFRMSWKYYQPFLGWVIFYESHMTLKRYRNIYRYFSQLKIIFDLYFHACY